MYCITSKYYSSVPLLVYKKYNLYRQYKETYNNSKTIGNFCPLKKNAVARRTILERIYCAGN